MGIIWDIIGDILRFGLLFGGGLVLVLVLMREREAHICYFNWQKNSLVIILSQNRKEIYPFIWYY